MKKIVFLFLFLNANTFAATQITIPAGGKATIQAGEVAVVSCEYGVAPPAPCTVKKNMISGEFEIYRGVELWFSSVYISDITNTWSQMRSMGLCD